MDATSVPSVALDGDHHPKSTESFDHMSRGTGSLGIELEGQSFLGIADVSPPQHNGPINGHEHTLSQPHNNRNDGEADGSMSSWDTIENSTGNSSTACPIAICGLGMRLPGGIRNGDDFWDLLVNGRDARSEIPRERWNVDVFDDSLREKNSIKTRFGYFLGDDISLFDPSFFSMSKEELEKCDPQQRLLLQVTRECLEDAGEVDYRGRPVGCYVGTFTDDWVQFYSKETQVSGNYVLTGTGDYMLANRVSFEYDLRGPSTVVKTACSSSLVALHTACRDLQAGDTSSAVVAGTNLVMSPATTRLMTIGGLLSPDGSCKSFDASANGYARGEGITAIYIKRLDDAIRDGNPVRAVIRGTGTNSDGRSNGMTVPRAEAHEAMIRKVYADAGLSISDTPFVECHGTGTAAGDPIETSAIGSVFGEKGVLIGSVKPNIGHGEGSAGLASLIKAILALENKTVPPNIKFNVPNPKIKFKENKLTVPTAPTPFPDDSAERISVNSFGVGGTNAHVILDSYSKQQNTAANGHIAKRPELVVLSANTQSSLKQQVELYKEFAVQHPSSLSDIAYTRAVRRERLPYKAFLIMEPERFVEASGVVRSSIKSVDRKVNMIFSGQGAQWPGMGKELIQTNSPFRDDIEAMDKILQSLADPPQWTIMGELQKPDSDSEMNKAELAQPLSTALQIAIFRQFERLGVMPTAVIGHSSGEIAAAYAAGYISMEMAVTAAYYRGFVTRKETTADGSMAAIGLGAKEVSKFLPDGVVVACENSPESTTISGDRQEVEQAVDLIKMCNPGTFGRALKIDRAYHSHHMLSLQEEYLHLMQQQTAVAKPEPTPRAQFISTVTGEAVTGAFTFSPDYWASNLMSPVKFSQAVSSLFAHSADMSVFLEIGPHSALSGPIRQICAAETKAFNYVSSQARGTDCAVAFLTAVGRLYQEDVSIRFEPLYPNGKVVPGLPLYPWDHSGPSFWHEGRLCHDWRNRSYAHHCLLGTRSPESPDAEPLWRNILSLDDVPWLVDHKVGKNIVFPLAGYVAMAGEAIRQVARADLGASYRLRHVLVRTALVLTESSPIEIVTTLRRKRLSDTEDSQWFDFTCTSYNGSAWVKHCEGEVMHTETITNPSWCPATLSRHVAAPGFYDAMHRMGLFYGPEFQPLESITSETTQHVAEAKLVEQSAHSAEPFTLHPASIDASLQLLFVAEAQGLLRNLVDLSVPTLIDELEISEGQPEMQVRAWCERGDPRLGQVECVADGRTVLRLKGLRLTPLHADDDGDESDGVVDKHAAARLQWLPDFDFVDPRELIRGPVTDKFHTKLEQELLLLCMLEEATQIADIEPCQPHFAKFRDWLNAAVDNTEVGDFPLIEDPAQLAQMSSVARQTMIDSHLGVLVNGPRRPMSIAARRLCDNAADIFTGKREALEVLMQDDILTQIYDQGSFGYGDFVRLLSNSRPNLRILEVGAGTGGTTELILRGLVDEGDLPGYSVYTFTDVSAGFFGKAQGRLSYAQNMEYRVFDITKSPFDQGFEKEARTYDLIVASNVIHATPSIRGTLSNLEPLLKPDGMLVLTELCYTTTKTPFNYSFGRLPGWWLGEADGRPHQPYITVERWDEELKAVGLTGVDTVMYNDEEEAYRYLEAIISRPKSTQAITAKRAALLCDDAQSNVARALKSHMEEKGWEITPCRLENTPPADLDIISCLDLEGGCFNDLTEQSFNNFKQFIGALGGQQLLWLTNPVQIMCKDPRSAPAISMIRTLRSELALSLTTLEIDNNEPKLADLVEGVFEKIRSAEESGNLAPDREYAVHEGTVCVPRFHPFSLIEALRKETTPNISPADKVRTLSVGKTGSLGSICWREEPAAPAVPDHCVEVEVRAVGLNFHDILLALGILEPEANETPDNVGIGHEVGAIIRRVGSAVVGLSPGDRVMGFSPNTNAITEASLVVRIPDEMTFQEAATIPVCFSTVMFSLIDRGRLSRGQSVLIHSACGGVGLAAMQVCQMLGVEMYVTVGSARKVDYLMEKFGIPRSHIFNSRDASFVEGVMRETSGVGVDMVLNSLSGELLHESWKCLAKYGTFLEIGKRDIVGSGRLDMLGFMDNRSYHAVDLFEMAFQKPAILHNMLLQFLEYYQQGHLKPLEHTAFDASQIDRAFRHFQQGDHIGKVVVTMPVADSWSAVRTLPKTRRMEFDPNSTYLLTGGVGGLGRSIVTWMAERGARHLTILSRSAGRDEKSKTVIAELESMGCSVTAVSGRVDLADDVHRAIRESKFPIKGVIHLAMVMRDASVMNMDWSQWTDVLSPKVQGAWNLHEALASHSLDFFWLASSLVTVVNVPGQANYNAANTFLEAFSQFRHRLNLPASVLNICPVEGVGFVAENAHALRNVTALGIYRLSEREFLDYMDHSLQSHTPGDEGIEPCVKPPTAWGNEAQLIMGLRSEKHLNDPNNPTSWRNDRRMGVYHNVHIEDSLTTKANGDALLDFLAQVAEEGGKAILAERSSVELLSHEIGRRIYKLMLKPEEEVDIGTTLIEMGLDSLMAVELRRWFTNVFGFHLTVLEIVSAGSLEQLATVTSTKLMERFHGETETNGEKTAAGPH